MKNYPLDPSIKNHVLIALVLSVWTFILLYFTQLIHITGFDAQEKLTRISLFGALAAVCYFCVYPFQSWFYNRNYKKWNFGSELLFVLLFLLFTFIAMRSLVYSANVGAYSNQYSLNYFLSSIFLPAILTSLPIVIIGRFAFGTFRYKRTEKQKIEIKGDDDYQEVRLLLSDLIALEASDNYVEIHFQNQGTYKKQLVRAQLSQLEKSFPDLLRTHRSFLINKEHFRSFKSKNSALGLVLSHDTFIPVSKTFSSEVKEALHFIES